MSNISGISSPHAFPETATRPASDAERYREVRRQQLLQEVNAIKQLGPELDRRTLRHIINKAIAEAFVVG